MYPTWSEPVGLGGRIGDGSGWDTEQQFFIDLYSGRILISRVVKSNFKSVYRRHSIAGALKRKLNNFRINWIKPNNESI